MNWKKIYKSNGLIDNEKASTAAPGVNRLFAATLMHRFCSSLSIRRRRRGDARQHHPTSHNYQSTAPFSSSSPRRWLEFGNFRPDSPELVLQKETHPLARERGPNRRNFFHHLWSRTFAAEPTFITSGGNVSDSVVKCYYCRYLNTGQLAGWVAGWVARWVAGWARR